MALENLECSTTLSLPELHLNSDYLVLAIESNSF